MEPIAGAVESVGSTLAIDDDLAAGRAGERSIFVGDLDTEFVHALDANGNDGLFRTAPRDDVVGDVDAVDHGAVLVAASSSDCATAISESSLVAVIRCGAGLKS